MNSRWSADSSTNDTTADRPGRRRRQRRQAGIVEPHRDLGGEVLEQVAGQPELGKDDQLGALRPRLRQQLVVPREVGVEVAQLGRELGEGDANGHGPSLAARRRSADRVRLTAGGAVGGIGRERRRRCVAACDERSGAVTSAFARSP